MVFYPNPVNVGTWQVNNRGDGYAILLKWHPAAPTVKGNKIAYNIFYSTIKEDVFTDGIKYASIDSYLETEIIDLCPGQEYFMAVRPVEYDPVMFDFSILPIAYNNIRYYPTSILSRDINSTDLIIPLMCVDNFPTTGIIQIGEELILYVGVDQVNLELIVAGGTGPSSAHFVVQSGGNYYLPSLNNIGNGTLNNLMIVGSGVTEDWIIKCIFVEQDLSGNPVPNTAKFIAQGSISGVSRDGYTNSLVWIANNNNDIISNGTFSFSIQEDSTSFQIGDSFTMQVVGEIPGIPNGRGYDNTTATAHTICGYDGYNYYSPVISFYIPGESLKFDRIFACQCRFDYPHYAHTIIDGYRQTVVDLLSTDLTAADAANVTFPQYDFAGWHRTDPVQLLNGTCVGSYIGGEMGCIDGYGNYNILRGFSLQDQNTQRQDVQLSVDGRNAILISRVKTGDICSCYTPASEYPDDRCPKCYGTKYVVGYQQYYNPRSSDGRIKVRVSPTAENLKMHEAGLESEFPLDMWTLTVPSIYTRDVIVLFDQDDNEEFRYEVGDVIRNNTILGLDGGQHMKTFRVRKFDPIYTIRVFRNTSDFPSKLNTTIGFVPGIPPHTHQIVINEDIMSICQINQTTAVSQGHNHPIVNGEVMEVLGHKHNIILPSQ